MKYWTSVLIILLSSCGGALSDEQRKKMHERMKDDEIKRVTEGELMSAAFDYGRAIGSIIEKRDPGMTNKKLLDSLESALNVDIMIIQPDDSALLAIESQVIEAYISAGNVAIPDDVQKLGTDSILYTKPLMIERPDGTAAFARALSIHMPIKSVILSIQE
jgi:hypothetical protein